MTIELSYHELETVISGLYRIIDLHDIGATSADDYGAALRLLNKLYGITGTKREPAEQVEE